MNQEELEKRTLEFAKNLIKALRKLPKNQINHKVSGQVFSSGTSIGANYREATASESPKDFKHKISICKKEARETKHWLRMIAVARPELGDEAKRLWQEAKELHLIFNAIIHSSNKKV